MNPIKGTVARSARLAQADRVEDRGSGFAEVLGRAESRMPAVKADPGRSRVEPGEGRAFDADPPESEDPDPRSREVEARARAPRVEERERAMEQGPRDERTSDEIQQKIRAFEAETSATEADECAGQVAAEKGSPGPVRRSRAGPAQEDESGSRAGAGVVPGVPSFGGERPVRVPEGFTEPSWGAFSASGGGALPRVAEAPLGMGAAGTRAATAPGAAATAPPPVAGANAATVATQSGVWLSAPSPAALAPGASPAAALPGAWMDVVSEAGDSAPDGASPWGRPVDTLAIRAPNSAAAAAPFGAVAGLATAAGAAAPDDAEAAALALTSPSMSAAPASAESTAVVVKAAQSFFASALAEESVGPGPPLPKQLTFEVDDPRGAWTLELRDHGRSLDVLIRGHASMAPVVAAAAADLRASLEQDGQALGMLEFIAADAGRERGPGAEGGERGPPRAARAPSRSPASESTEAGPARRVGGRIDRIA